MSVREWANKTANALPFLGALGMAFWLAWFGVAYGSSVWVQPTEATTSVVSEMFISSTLAHAFVLIVAAFLAPHIQRIVRATPVLLGSGLLATLGCVIVILAGPPYFHSRTLFLIGCVCTGIGTAAFSLNSGLVLCIYKPRESLKTLLIIEIVSILLQFMIYGLPHPVGLTVFTVMPLLSAACFSTGSHRNVSYTFREVNRLMPQKIFLVLLAAILILSVAANVSRGIYSSSIGPIQAASDGSLNNLLTCLVFALLFVFIYPNAQRFNFSHWFYVGAILIIAALACTYIFAGEPGIAMSISTVSYSVFDLVTWYIFAYYVYQSKVSAIAVFASGRAVIGLGVTLGNLIGSFAMQPIVLLLVFLASLSVFLILPEKRIDKLLAPIPDEDSQAQEPFTEAAGIGIPAPLPGNSSLPEADIEAILITESEAEVIASAGTSPAEKRPWKALMETMASEYGLTDRESEVFIRLAKGRGSQSISDELVVSLYTTRAHTRNIYTKLDVHSRKELMDKATEYYEAHLGE